MEEFPFMQRAQSLFRFDLMTENPLRSPTPSVSSTAPSTASSEYAPRVFPSSLNHSVTVATAGTQISFCYLLLSFSPQRESRALAMRRHGHGNRYSPVDAGIAPSAFPSAQPSLHIKRALDSRCDENDGVGLPDSHCGSNNGYQVTSSYLPLHGPERGHRNADNEKALVAPPVRLLAVCPSATLTRGQNGGERAHCLITAGSLLRFLPPVSLTNFSHRLESAWCGF